jgi:processive 1,2-diacylglycerol beta-glucosyltransferase
MGAADFYVRIMTSSQKILILYASAGAGHKKAAEALADAAQSQGKDVVSRDIVDFMPSLTRWCYTKGYTLAITKFLWFWGLLYKAFDAPWLSLMNVRLRKFVNAIVCHKLIKYLKDEKPKVVISTHFLASEAVSYLKEKHPFKASLTTVVTDFGVHNFWIAPRTDLYCCASQESRQALLRRGIEDERIKVTGIPLHQKFRGYRDREEVCQKLNIKSDCFTVLIATGRFGAGPIEKALAMFKEDQIQFLVVCGHNAKLYNSLQSKNFAFVRLFGFVENMEELMAVSHLMLTKAGGLTVTEALNTGLPMIFFFLVPGQEMINAKILETAGAGSIVTSLKGLRETILRFRENAGYLASFKEKALSLAKPDSCQHILSWTNSPS